MPLINDIANKINVLADIWNTVGHRHILDYCFMPYTYRSLRIPTAFAIIWNSTSLLVGLYLAW